MQGPDLRFLYYIDGVKERLRIEVPLVLLWNNEHNAKGGMKNDS